MIWSRQLRAQPLFREGMHDFLPQALGVAAWGLMTGVAMVNSGMSVFEAVAMALLVYAGSAQLAAMPLIMAGAPAWVVLAAGFCVNLRFVVFSLHMRPYLMHLSRWQRLATGYFVTDNTYVLFTRRFHTPGTTPAEQQKQQAHLTGLSAANWLCWMSASMVGIALANLIPTRWGLGFAGILCLLGIQCSLASSRLRIVAAAVAGMASVAAYALPLKLNIVLAIAAAVICALVVESFKSDASAGGRA